MSAASAPRRARCDSKGEARFYRAGGRGQGRPAPASNDQSEPRLPLQIAQKAWRNEGARASDHTAANEQAMHPPAVAVHRAMACGLQAARQADGHPHGEQVDGRQAGDIGHRVAPQKNGGRASVARALHAFEQVRVQPARGETLTAPAQTEQHLARLIAHGRADGCGTHHQAAVHLPELLRIELRHEFFE